MTVQETSSVCICHYKLKYLLKLKKLLEFSVWGPSDKLSAALLLPPPPKKKKTILLSSVHKMFLHVFFKPADMLCGKQHPLQWDFT